MAGDNRDGGAARKCSSGDQMGGGEALRDAGARPRLVQQAAAARVAGVERGVGLGGGRSSGALGNGAAVAVEWRA